MQLKLETKNILASLVVFLALLFKYIGLWSYLFIEDYIKLKIILIIIAFLILMILYILKIPIKELKKILILGILVLVVTVITGAIDLFISYLFAISYFTFKDSVNKYINTFFKWSLILFLITIFMDIIGVLPTNYSYRNVDGIYVIRKNLGFPGINSLFLCLAPIILSFWVKYGKKINKGKRLIIVFLMFLLCLIFYKYTLSRTGFLCMIILFTFITFPRIIDNKIAAFIFKYQYFLFALFSIFIAMKFGNPYDNGINEILSHRPYYWNLYVSNMRISLLGNELNSNLPLDNTYLTFLYIYGFISYLIISILHIITFKQVRSNFYIYVSLAVFAIYGLFENNYIYYQNFIFTVQLLIIIKGSKKEGWLTCE